MARATDDLLADLHGAIADELLRKVKSGEATAQELQAAIKFLKDNNISSVVEPGNNIDKLSKALPTFDDEEDKVVQFTR